MTNNSITNKDEILRDFNTVQTAFYNIFPKIKMSINTKDKQRFLDQEKFKAEVFKHIDFLRCKVGDKKKIIVPNSHRGIYDGNILHRQIGLTLHFIIPVINNEGETKLVWSDCYNIKTDRGLCWVCLNQHFIEITKGKLNFVTKDGFIVVKDHAIRRVIERSPIKAYESALGFILWSMAKNKVRYSDSMEIEGDCTIVKKATATHVEYKNHGRIVGTRFQERESKIRAAIVLINTYILEN